MEKMNVLISFKVYNPDYNKQYADEYHFKEESESNPKYKEGVTYEVKNIVSISTIKNEDYILKGQFKDRKSFEYSIPNVTICRCMDADGNHTDFAVSNSVLNKIHQTANDKYKTAGFYFYINYEPASVQIEKNLFVDERDVPQGLLLPQV